MATEVRTARLAAGLTQREAAASVGISEGQVARIERGEIEGLTVVQAAHACAAVGLKFVARMYPDRDAVRDAPQLALLERFRRELPVGARWRTEVPLAARGDLRAWDGEARFSDGVVKVEAESRLRDIQAVERRIALKQRDDGVDRVILLVNDTPASRAALRLHREALRERFPLDGRAILAAIRASRSPQASGILLL